MTGCCYWSVDSLFNNIGWEGVATADADRVPGEHARLLLTSARQAEIVQRGEEDLAVVGGDEVVQHRVDCWADIEQHVGDHVEIVVEVIESAKTQRMRETFRQTVTSYSQENVCAITVQSNAEGFSLVNLKYLSRLPKDTIHNNLEHNLFQFRIRFISHLQWKLAQK